MNLWPIGTAVCGYSRGSFYDIAMGTMSVAFAFDSLNRGIYYKKEMRLLSDVVNELIMEIANNSSDTVTVSQSESIDDDRHENLLNLHNITELIEGHILMYNNESKQIDLYLDEHYNSRYFIPYEDYVLGPGYFGMFCNDLAYNNKLTTKEEYIESSYLYNILQIVWRMEFLDGKLRPIWPIVVVNRDVLFRNQLPMEAGLSYSWKYWEAARLLESEMTS